MANKYQEFFQTILRDHDLQREIMKKLVQTGPGAEQDRLWTELSREFLPHVRAEEASWYPKLSENPESREDALEALEEHHVSELVYDELKKMPERGDRWHAKMQVFQETVEHHLEEEEKKIFKLTKQVLPEQEMEKIAAAYTQEKSRAMSTV